MTAHTSTFGDRTLSAFLVLAMVVGSFALWLAVPAGILWGLGKLVDTQVDHLMLGLLCVPLGMIAFGVVLAWLNTLYLRINGFRVEAADHDGPWKPRLRAPLDRIMGTCAIVATVAFIVWIVLGPSVTGPVAPW